MERVAEGVEEDEALDVELEGKQPHGRIDESFEESSNVVATGFGHHQRSQVQHQHRVVEHQPLEQPEVQVASARHCVSIEDKDL